MDRELSLNVLESSDPSHHDKENATCEQRKKTAIKLNLSAAMGGVCCDFDFGSPLFASESKFAQGALLSVPIYVLCENGEAALNV